MRIVLASNNRHKLIEMQAVLSPAGVELISPQSLGWDFSVEETGATFRENALIKARACYAASGLPSLGDDSGLVVDALDGRPGVYSARYAGGHGNDAANIRRVLEELETLKSAAPRKDVRRPAAAMDAAIRGAAPRAARFVCALAYMDASGQEHFFDGEVAGVLAEAPSGTGGFGYDPIFYLPEKQATMAELSLEEKNELSHRARALRAFISWLRGG
ncbi:MAG: non-canonical purine NTP pyrophosphatase [Spirochaetota bacterium]|nr:non-canonical purine NTP pyrophosphatase [Spirochaetota bacterium]